MVPALPQDLIQPIVQHINGDFQTLKACTLTSHRWYLESRKLLHAQLRYWWGKKHLGFYKKNPQLLNCVKTFYLYSDKHCLEWEHSDLRDVHLPNVTSLHIVNTHFPDAPDLFAYFKQNFPSLTSLSLESVWFSSPNCSSPTSISLPSLITSFPLLSTLHLRNVSEVPCLNNLNSKPQESEPTDEECIPNGDVALSCLRHVELDTSSGSIGFLNFAAQSTHGHDGHRDCDVVTAAPVTFVNVEMSRDQYWLPISWTEVARELDQLADAFGSTLEVLRVSHASRTHVSETDTNGKYPLYSSRLPLFH